MESQSDSGIKNYPGGRGPRISASPEGRHGFSYIMPLVTLILYTRKDCHLCEDMHRQLQELQCDYRFEIDLRDVDAHPDWTLAYSDKVPLLLAGSDEVCQYFLDLEALIQRVVP